MEEDKIAVLDAPAIKTQKEEKKQTTPMAAEVKQEKTAPSKSQTENSDAKISNAQNFELKERTKSSEQNNDEAFIEEIVISSAKSPQENIANSEKTDEKQEKVIVEKKKEFLTIQELAQKYEETTKNEELFQEALKNKGQEVQEIEIVPNIEEVTEIPEIQEIPETESAEIEVNETLKKERLPKRTSAKKSSAIIIEKPYSKWLFWKKQKGQVTYAPNVMPKKRRFKQVLFGVVLCFCAVFCITNTIIVENARHSVVVEQEKYDVNIAKYFEKISALDKSNDAMDMFETYPEQLQAPESTVKKSNWFDRLCNWFSNLFGG